MSRKLWLGVGATLIVVMMIGISVSGIARAQGGGYNPLAQTRSVAGTVTQVSGNSFTIRTPTGQQLHFQFDTGTQFVNGQQQGLQGSALSIGSWVTVFAAPSDRSRATGGVRWSSMAADKGGESQFDRKQLRSFGGARWVVRSGSRRTNMATATRVIIGTQNAAPASTGPTSPAASPTAPAATPQASPTTAPAGAATASPTPRPTATP